MSTPNQDLAFSDHEKIANTSQHFCSSNSQRRLLSKQLRTLLMPEMRLFRKSKPHVIRFCIILDSYKQQVTPDKVLNRF